MHTFDGVSEYHTAASLPARVRLQEYGIGHFPTAPTRSAWKKALKGGRVTVEGQLATTATWITGGEVIALTPAPPTTSRRPLVLPLAVLYEDEQLAVVRKPAGVLVSGDAFKTVAAALPQNLQPSGLPDACRPWPVHRLDFPTTGVLLVGKTRAAIRDLSAALAAQRVTKTYLAVVIGALPERGDVNFPIDGKPAGSSYRVLGAVPSGRFGRLSLLRLRPRTGRRHQLRKHLASLGTPVLGDRDYGREGLVLQGKGLYLHALSLRFEHPNTGEVLEATDETPHRFRKLFPVPLGEQVLCDADAGCPPGTWKR